MSENLNGVNETFTGGFTIAIPRWNITELNGYEPKTTFWEDFSIADAFGVDAIKDTFERAFNEWKGNVEYLTELALVLNHKGFQWYGRNEAMSRLYFKLWEEADAYACDNLKGEDYEYYYRWTD